MKKIALLMLDLYQKVISPALPRSCRFHPTCSEYTKQAVVKYGLIKGAYMGLKRVLRCHPWNRGGFDPLE